MQAEEDEENKKLKEFLEANDQQKMQMFNKATDEEKLDMFMNSDDETKMKLFDKLNDKEKAKLFKQLDLDEQVKLFGQLSDQDKLKLWNQLSDDERMRLWNQLSDDEKQKLLLGMSDKERQKFMKGLSDDEKARLLNGLSQKDQLKLLAGLSMMEQQRLRRMSQEMQRSQKDEDQEAQREAARLEALRQEEEEEAMRKQAEQENLADLMAKGDDSDDKIYHRPSENSDELNIEDGVAFNQVYSAIENDDAMAAADQESIYSHQTTEILDEEKVSFMHIGGMPEDAQDEEEYEEYEMVHYHKDDTTNYSKHLGLNKVPKRKPHAPYYSENDVQEEEEDKMAEADSQEEEYNSADPDAYERNKRAKQGFQNDEIDGRVKVDSWNLNYSKRKKRFKKKKMKEDDSKKFNELKNIYGVDARTMAGLDRRVAASQVKGGGGQERWQRRSFALHTGPKLNALDHEHFQEHTRQGPVADGRQLQNVHWG